MGNIIEVKNLGKEYKICHQSASYKTLRDNLADFFRQPVRTIRDSRQAKREKFWALEEIDFSVGEGGVVGVIGPNGAGKSTLLKILSRITMPTTGRARIRGRVGSLLEVGTGFHPELTGRENIFFNGAILGMTKAEIKRKFDEIVDFSGIEKFLDTPVKRYSSGMQVRLAFSVAAHLEPEVLLIDEVLAVGDYDFQKKCLGKMDEVTKSSGRTIIFVSHNMGAISRLCKKCLVLKNGCNVFYGETKTAINSYLLNPDVTLSDTNKMPSNNLIKLCSVKIESLGEIKRSISITESMTIVINYEVLKEGLIFTHGCNLYNEDGVNILNSHDVMSEYRKKPHKKGSYTAKMFVPGNFFSEGNIYVGVAFFCPEPFKLFLHELNIATFEVIDSMEKDSARGPYRGGFPGVIRPLFKWESIKSD